jgi:mono/diheme cytochrome c family protein
VQPVLVAGFVGALVAACGGSDPTTASPDDGAALYAANCASCHGADLGGTDEGPSHLSVVYEPGHHPDDAFRAAIRNGAPEHHWDFGPMPPIAGLDDDEVEAITDYVRAEQERQGFER